MSKHPGSKVIFHNDTECKTLISKVHSAKLAAYFDQEKSGAFKSDICRLAMLYQYGGYYLDNDIETITDISSVVPGDASFVSALAAYQPNPRCQEVWNAFIGSTPKHWALKDALDRTR